MSSSLRSLHASIVDLPVRSMSGASSTLSTAMTLKFLITYKSASSNYVNDTPPASCVPVPGNSPGSSTSKSTVRYTGVPSGNCSLKTSSIPNIYVSTWPAAMNSYSLASIDLMPNCHILPSPIKS